MNYAKELNFHYGKNIKLIGGIDLNPEKHLTEYSKRYQDRSPENAQKNPQYYLTALAARKYHKYMQMVHGGDPRFDRSAPMREFKEMKGDLSNMDESFIAKEVKIGNQQHRMTIEPYRDSSKSPNRDSQID